MDVEVETLELAVRGRTVIWRLTFIRENFNPPREVTAREMEVIPPGTHVNVYEAYDIVKKVKDGADILVPLHEPAFASMRTLPRGGLRRCAVCGLRGQ